ncbi:hypothetical protein SAMN02799624_05905 [Paenibacillus sp. UNC496MF]|uniref:hypothetical protein n=1 Tax=Paenibacillus sp. UNC496MF TaxID=1502753 RepID=UPI0008F3ABAE|nr:hypothetical protein [Paenibacillus sp. UNC496MF]SFJ77185.1 hypothetical protein SAMN02799624_05905 [Paenibacillus sp. UNC496MF]
MKKTKTKAVPGKPIVMKLREDEETSVLQWLNLQSVYSDSIRYLIQKEIAENGLRNLQHFIPQHRTVETLKSMNVLSGPGATQIDLQPDLKEQEITSAERITRLTTDPDVSAVDTFSLHEHELSEGTDLVTGNDDSVIKNDFEPKSSDNTPIDKQTVAPGSSPRPAKKVFGADVTSSYAN